MLDQTPQEIREALEHSILQATLDIGPGPTSEFRRDAMMMAAKAVSTQDVDVHRACLDGFIAAIGLLMCMVVPDDYEREMKRVVRSIKHLSRTALDLASEAFASGATDQ